MQEFTEKSLFDGFGPVSAEAWRAQIEKDLKGKPYDKVVWRPEPGLEIHPFYLREQIEALKPLLNRQPGAGSAWRGNAWNAEQPGWQSVQPVAVDLPEAARLRITEALASETHSFSLYAWGKQPSPDALPLALKDFPFDQAALHLDPGEYPIDWLNQLIALGPPTASLTGTLSFNLENGFPEVAAVREALTSGANYPWFRALGLDLRFAGEAGLSFAQQLGMALAALAEAAHRGGEFSPAQVFEQAALRFCIGPSFFMEIGRLRAWRVLYAQFATAYGLDESVFPPFVLAETARWNQARYDMHTNLLRLTTAAMSAALGGCQGLIIHGFDTVSGPESGQSARLARNIQHLLRYESYLDAVTDASGGAYYLEEITRQLAEAGWKAFQAIESAGGYASWVESGALSQAVNQAQAARAQQVATRRKVVVGVNQYPNTLEVIQDEWQPGPFATYRVAQPYEAIRKAADAYAGRSGKRLQAYLFLFGDVAMRGARALFSRDLLGAGGFEVVETASPNDPEAALAEIAALQPELVVLCSSDADYLQSADELLSRAKEAAPRAQLLLAGKPEGWSRAHIEQIYAGMDAPAFLSALVGRLLPLTT